MNKFFLCLATALLLTLPAAASASDEGTEKNAQERNGGEKAIGPLRIGMSLREALNLGAREVEPGLLRHDADWGGAVFLIEEKKPTSSLFYFIIQEKRRGHVLAFLGREDGVFPSFSSMKRTIFQFVSLRIRCKRTPWKQRGMSLPFQHEKAHRPHFPPTGQT